ncbi:RNA polymerase sigma factor [Amycolatopsis samaneae]|uniref:RNA polymerase sigma factor n=1 Tax=Amycolatopsis samaneae TaxID=664691 RepID=A0ABW5GKC5_9PSEU
MTVPNRVQTPSPTVRRDENYDDATLVARARDGDTRAYEQLVSRYQVPIFGLATRMLRDRGDAEDTVQEVFLNAWRHLDQLHDGAAFLGWLCRATTNRCLNTLRARRPVRREDFDQLPSPHAAQRPDHAAQTSAQLAALLAALDQLTADQRACWLLREVHGLSYADIAAAVETSATAVRGRIARARAHLAEAMTPWR